MTLLCLLCNLPPGTCVFSSQCKHTKTVGQFLLCQIPPWTDFLTFPLMNRQRWQIFFSRSATESHSTFDPKANLLQWFATVKSSSISHHRIQHHFSAKSVLQLTWSTRTESHQLRNFNYFESTEPKTKSALISRRLQDSNDACNCARP